MSEFYWGVSAAAAQTEGAALTDGRGPSVWDEFCATKKRVHERATPEPGTDFYNRFREDVNIIAQLQIPNFRFSLSWSRILPAGFGTVNQKGLDFYKRLVDECLEKSVTPWITLYHWDLPQAIEDKGGWTNRDVLNYFEEYTSVCIKALGDRVKNWMILNEPMAFCGAGYFLGVHAPGKRGRGNFVAAAHHAALATAAGANIVRSGVQQAHIGSTYSFSLVTPYSGSERDIAAAARVNDLLNNFFLFPAIGKKYPLDRLKFLRCIEKHFMSGDESRLKADLDFIGIQNYTREVVKHSWYTPYIKANIVSAAKRNVPHTEMGWEVYPEGIYQVLKNVASLGQVPPLIVTENGAAFQDHLLPDGSISDQQRIAFLNDYITQVLRAKNEGVDVRGYFVWSATDNFEWAEGYRPRFGLVHIDYQNNLKRTIKESGRWYSDRIRNGI